MKRTLLSGDIVELPMPSGKLGTFLRRVLAAAEDHAVSERDLCDLVYGPENPLLVALYRDPVFVIMVDCLARKRMPTSVVTVREAAEQLGISESAVRQAIQAKRLRAQKDGGTYYLDPRSVAEYRVTGRGPKPRRRR